MAKMTEEEKALLRQKKADYDFVFKSDAGKRVLKDLMDKCSFFKELDRNLVGNDFLLKAEGRRTIFLYILQNLTMRELEVLNFLDDQLDLKIENEDDHI
jgi:hypothetical protein